MEKHTNEVEDNQMRALSWKTRVSYGLGDTACNVVYGMIGSLLTIFYTDYVGISAAAIGVIMLISRIFDGCSDVIMGFVVNKTHSKYGQSRPWILWMAIPYAVSAVLLFTVPHTATNIQLIYIFVTYNFTATVCYTALNLPYGSLSAMMTRSSRERDMLSIVRMALSPIGRIMAVTFTTPLVKLFGDDQAAWVKTMAIWAVLALLMLITCFKNCEEKVKIKVVKKEKIPVGKTFSALLKNQYFWAVLILWMMQNVITSITGTILPYYCKYILGNDTWMYRCIIHGRNSYIDRSYFMQSVIIKTTWKEKYVLDRVYRMSDRTIRIHGQAREFLLVTWMLYHQRNLFCTIKLCNLRNVRRCCRIWSVENTFTSGEFHLRDRICWYKAWKRNHSCSFNTVISI